MVTADDSSPELLGPLKEENCPEAGEMWVAGAGALETRLLGARLICTKDDGWLLVADGCE